MPKIYISYSRQDTLIAKEVHAELLQCGYKTFLDIDDVINDGLFAQQLISQLKSADLVVFIVSEASLNSQWCQREIDYAQNLGKRIVPIAVSRRVLEGSDSDFYKSRLSSLCIIVWDDLGRYELPRLLKSLFIELYTRTPDSQDKIYNIPSISSPLPGSRFRKGWFKKYGFIITFVLLLALLVFYALYPVGSSKVPTELEEPSILEPYPDVEIDNDYGYADSCFIIDTVECAAAEVVEPPLSEDSHALESPAITTPSITIQPEVSDSLAVGDDISVQIPEIVVDMDQKISSENDTSFDSFWILAIIVVILGVVVYWLYSRRKFRVKIVSNMDCLLFVDNKKLASLKAKTVEVISLRKGQYYFIFRPLNDKIKERNITISVSRNGELINMEFQERQENDKKTIKCFIAGSTHLEAARNALRAGIAQTHNKWRGRNFEILSYTYEDFEKKAVDGGHQNKYDEFIENEATLAVFIICGEIGQYTVNEFEKAMNAFKQSKHPQVLVFNDKNAPLHEHSEELKKKVVDNKQYWSNYESLNDLKQQFMHTLDWMLIEMFL